MSLLDDLVRDGEITARECDQLATIKMTVGDVLALATETTREQLLAIVRLAARYSGRIDRLRTMKGVFGLPDDYVTVLLIKNGWQGPSQRVVLEAGVDAEGRVST